jgi:hypothetical protein
VLERHFNTERRKKMAISIADFAAFLHEEVKLYAESDGGFWALGAESQQSPVAIYLKKRGLFENPVVLGSWAVEHLNPEGDSFELPAIIQRFAEKVERLCSRYDGEGKFAYSMPIFPEEALSVWQQTEKEQSC